MGLWQLIRRLFGLDAASRETMWGDTPGTASSSTPTASPTAMASPTMATSTSASPADAAGRPGLADLSRRLGMGIDELQKVPTDYHEFDVPKRSGGTRRLAAPNAALKMVQRRILHRLLRRLRAHDSACGYEKGKSIYTNAQPHCRAAIVLKLDIRDFFHSTSADRVRAYFRAIGWDGPAAELLTKLCTHKGHLPQGAPTSPRISNLVNVQLDVRLSALASAFQGRYTRYADDMTFSLPEEDREGLRAFIRVAKVACRETGYSLHQDRKLQVRRPYERQQVTGLVVNHRPNLPRRTRRWLRAVEHHIATGKQSTLTADQLQGWHALRRMIQQQCPG